MNFMKWRNDFHNKKFINKSSKNAQLIRIFKANSRMNGFL